MNVLAKTRLCPWYNSIPCGRFASWGLFGSRGFSGNVDVPTRFTQWFSSRAVIFSLYGGSLSDAWSSKIALKCVLGDVGWDLLKFVPAWPSKIFYFGASVVGILLMISVGAPDVLRMNSMSLPKRNLISLMCGARCGAMTIPKALSSSAGVEDMLFSHALEQRWL